MRKAQTAGSAAAFISIMTALIVVYILFLPPNVRDDILNDGNKGNTINYSGTDYGQGTQYLLIEQIGQVSYLNTRDRVYDLPSIRVSSSIESKIIRSSPGVLVRSALFDKEREKYDMQFNIDKSATQRVLVSFAINEGQGPLIIELNGAPIYSGDMTAHNVEPIIINPELLAEQNILTIRTTSPGLIFWRANEYKIQNLQIAAEVKDTTNSRATASFSISSAEKENIDTIKLSFSPECNLQEVNTLEISLNNRVIYDSVADCGSRTTINLNKADVDSGANELKFYSTKGTYLLDSINVKLALQKASYKTYFFNVDSKYFGLIDNARCGDYDSKCPAGCSASTDADCCFRDNMYWCALPTTNANDRCVAYVDPRDCGRCLTGYYNSAGNAPATCEDVCGDNNDNSCPAGCINPKKYYDKDCCFAENENNYWCKETPISGLSTKCTTSVSRDQCTQCNSGYVRKDGSSPDACNGVNNNPIIDEDDYTLADNYEVRVFVQFADDSERKRVNLDINGHVVAIDTNTVKYEKVITEYIKKNANSIQIVPRQDVTITELKIILIPVR